MDLDNIKQELEKNDYCEDCVFNKTCEVLIDNYEEVICRVLEKEIEKEG